MTPLVSADEVREWVPAQPEDEIFLNRLSIFATGIVMEAIGPDPVTLEARDWTEETVPDPVRVAILLVLTELWAHRGDAAPTELTVDSSTGRLSPLVERLLVRFREPVVS